MESVFVRTRLKVEIKEMAAVVVVEVVPEVLVVDPEITMSVRARVSIEVRHVLDMRERVLILERIKREEILARLQAWTRETERTTLDLLP